MATGFLDNFYARLGLQVDATYKEIKLAYHRAALKFHPDTTDKSGSTELFLQIQEAYETLSNPKLKTAYDKTLPPGVKGLKDVLTNTIYSKNKLGFTNSKQLVYALVNLGVVIHEKEGGIHNKLPLNICIVVDTSTSMKGERIEAVKSTTLKLIKNLKREDYISIVSFNDKASVILPATQNPNINIVSSHISQLATKGGTELFQGLSVGADEINKHYNPGMVNHIILLTDGKTYGDEEKCLSLATHFGQKGISVSGLGIGKDWNEEFLEDLVKNTGGDTVYAADSNSIANFLNTKFFQLSNTYATNVYLDYEIPKNVELKYVFRISPNTNSIQKKPLKLGDLPIDKSLTFLLEFVVDKVPKSKFPFILMEGNLHMTIPGKRNPNLVQRFDLSRPVGNEASTEPPPQILIRSLSKLSLYRLQEEAYIDIKNGNIEKATRKLNNLATQLLVSGEPILAHTVLQEIDKLEGGINSDGGNEKKQIKYGTRALLLPAGKEFP